LVKKNPTKDFQALSNGASNQNSSPGFSLTTGLSVTSFLNDPFNMMENQTRNENSDNAFSNSA